MDLIEFYLSLPNRYKIAFNPNSKTYISFEKKLFREIATTILPYNLVYRKKGFVLSTDRNKVAESFFKDLESKYDKIIATNNFEKLALNILLMNMGIKHN